MKHIWLIATCLFINSSLMAQSSQPASIQSELKDIANFNPARQSGFERFQSYKGSVNGSQFFTDNWAQGYITATNGTRISGGYTLLFDKVRQLLFAKPNNADGAALVEYGKVKDFTINSDRVHKFVPASTYDSTNHTDFYEVLTEGNQATLLKLTNTTFQKADRNTSTGVWQDKLNDAYIDHYTYFIYQNGKLEKISLKEGAFKKALKAYTGKISNYTATHYGEPTDENYYTHLVEVINQG